MNRIRPWATRATLTTLVAVVLLGHSLADAADRPNKCVVNGTVTYQREVCPSNAGRERPTVEQLNAERKKRLEQAKATTGAAPAPAPAPHAAPQARPSPAAQPTQAFACDGRTRCPQMRSCAEARYFLANCPNVKMDGDGDGIPCEEQWCR
jgi:hypothetical protein